MSCLSPIPPCWPKFCRMVLVKRDFFVFNPLVSGAFWSRAGLENMWWIWKCQVYAGASFNKFKENWPEKRVIVLLWGWRFMFQIVQATPRVCHSMWEDSGSSGLMTTLSMFIVTLSHKGQGRKGGGTAGLLKEHYVPMAWFLTALWNKMMAFRFLSKNRSYFFSTLHTGVRLAEHTHCLTLSQPNVVGAFGCSFSLDDGTFNSERAGGWPRWCQLGGNEENHQRTRPCDLQWRKLCWTLRSHVAVEM